MDTPETTEVRELRGLLNSATSALSDLLTVYETPGHTPVDTHRHVRKREAEYRYLVWRAGKVQRRAGR